MFILHTSTMRNYLCLATSYIFIRISWARTVQITALPCSTATGFGWINCNDNSPIAFDCKVTSCTRDSGSTLSLIRPDGKFIELSLDNIFTLRFSAVRLSFRATYKPLQWIEHCSISLCYSERTELFVSDDLLLGFLMFYSKKITFTTSYYKIILIWYKYFDYRFLSLKYISLKKKK